MVKKILCVMLSLLLCTGIFPLSVSAKKIDSTPYQPLDAVTVFVEGIASSDIYDVESGNRIFPPSGTDLFNAIAGNLPSFVRGYLKNDYKVLSDAIVSLALTAFGKAGMDENGNPKTEQKIKREMPTKEEIKKTVSSCRTDHRICFCYDWRQDVKTTAHQLHDFVLYVMEAAEVQKLNLVGFSMGTSVVLSFLKEYEGEYESYLNGVVLTSAGCNGASSCGQPFTKSIAVDKTLLLDYIDELLPQNLLGNTASGLIHKIAKWKFVDEFIAWLNAYVKANIDTVYDDMFMQTFGSMPGLWSLVPADYFEQAKQRLPEDSTQIFLNKVDWYHDEVALKQDEIIGKLFENNIRFGIIAKYGYAVMPIMADGAYNSDSVIDTKYESFGAICADIHKTLGTDYVQKVDNGHDCISPDNIIDASTCKYCDRTWFLKNCNHSDGLSPSMEIAGHIFFDKKELTVWNGKYPQFLIYINGEVEPLNAENDYSVYFKDSSLNGLWKMAQTSTKEKYNDFADKIGFLPKAS